MLLEPLPPPSPRAWELLRFPPARAARLAALNGWIGPALVTLLAGVLRFGHLGSPRAVVFDETYYAKDAWSLLRYGYEGTWSAGADVDLLARPQRIDLSAAPEFIAHPPVGKWLIALGEAVFGLTPFGWRFVPALLGTLSVLMLCRIGRRLLRSTWWGALAGLLLTFDGLHFVMSRTALLDIVLMFWVLAAFGCLLIDRDAFRARLASGDGSGGGAGGGGGWDEAVVSEDEQGSRPWRLAAGVCLGLACGTKWSGAYSLAAFGLLTVAWDVGAYRAAGAARPWRVALRRQAVPAFAALVPVAFATYLASWTGWLVGQGGYARDWAVGQDLSSIGPLGSWVPAPLISLVHYHQEIWGFHLALSTPHRYQSDPLDWLLLTRPVSYFFRDSAGGSAACRAEGCTREILALGTPLLWWTALVALGYLLHRLLRRRDWRAGAVLAAVAAGYLPWFLYQGRTLFSFYTVAFVPFLCLAVAMLLADLAGRPGPALPSPRGADGGAGAGAGAGAGTGVGRGAGLGASRRSVRWARLTAAGLLTVAVAVNFAWFLPLYTGQAETVAAWESRIWFDSWI
ncbi:dolichyl-phosphate-mannose--protein mannosyltransferase [Kitasatospora mediocidica]|uniref:dolichyl-phosphate-mannose--protein mannosyltransferase n=1 Tax=Kitasatospora mediocidica TaxID=58352 RepID=UPI00068E451E|nr:phospholipid carrier-dependent glycosyltransferase [Kitasatospora mediocidica]